MLRETDGYLSGQYISERIGVTRTSVWKVMRGLKEEGYPIEAVTNKGYRLLSVDNRDIFNAQEIQAQLHTDWAGHPLSFKEVTGSTNTDTFAASDMGMAHGFVMVTGQQTAGKGRRGREWISPPDRNIYMSILLKPQFRAEIAPMLTLVMALSVCEAVAQYCGQIGQEQAEHCRFGIKWPNDLVVSVDGGPYKKCCGILTEMRIEEMEIRDIVVGIGINVNQMAFPAEIRETATSIALAMGRSPEMNGLCRAAITAKVWERFEENYTLFEKAQSLRPLTDAYESVLVNTGREVHVLDPKGPYTGTALGITEGGDLIVRPTDGSANRQVSSGEVSVRGMNGYV